MRCRNTFFIPGSGAGPGKGSGHPPGLLTLEITESVQGIDPDYLKEQIRRFHEAGFKVWMDDFGSGFSSLNVLQDFDFDLIKLDMKFLKGFGTNRKNPVILKKIIEMANDLGIDTLVEGVETKEQARFLKEIGCDKLQGMYYHRPIPLEEIIALQNEPGGQNTSSEQYEASALDVQNAYDDNYTDYLDTIPQFFYYNAFSRLRYVHF